MRRILGGLVLVLVVALSAWLWLAQPVDRPNILLVTIDSLRADHLGAYGYPLETSPVIDGLAAGGVVFDLALAPATLSGPSHATMMTSLDVPVHRVINNAIKLEDDQLTLAEVLSAAGYETAMFVSHPLVSEEFGFDQGFDTEETWTVHSHAADHDHEDDVEQRDPPNAVFDAAIRWLETARQRPFFVWLHAQHAHKSYEPPEPFNRRFGERPASARPDIDCLETLSAHQDREIDLSPEERAYVVAQYDGEIAYIDEQIGRVLATLSASGTADDTIVVVTSDHGEMLFDDVEQRITGHGRHRFDTVLRVPLIFHGPIPEPQRNRAGEMVGLIDLAPTLLELAGLRRPASFRGSSLVPHWQGSTEPTLTTNFSCTFHTDGTIRLSSRTTERKLFCDKKADAWDCSYFDLRADPREHRDLWDDPDRRGEAEAARLVLEGWFHEMTATGRLLEARPSGKRARRLLERAGYLDEE